jgi:hypothetical protein
MTILSETTIERFEVVIVIPAVQMKADGVWLITHNNPSVDKGHQFVASIRDKLKQERIECLQTEADRTDLMSKSIATSIGLLPCSKSLETCVPLDGAEVLSFVLLLPVSLEYRLLIEPIVVKEMFTSLAISRIDLCSSVSSITRLSFSSLTKSCRSCRTCQLS